MINVSKIKKVLWELYDLFIWTIFLLTISLFILYLTAPIITYYFNLYQINSLSTDQYNISKKVNFKEIDLNKGKWQDVDNNLINLKRINKKVLSILKNKKVDNKLKHKTLNKNEWQNINKKEINLLNKFPITDFIYNTNKIYINWGSSNVIYRDIHRNIQQDLWQYSVISKFYWTPIIFTHSSGWKYNFWLYYLHLQKGDYIYLEGKYSWIKYYIEGIVTQIYKNIPWGQLYNWLVNIRDQHNYKKDKTIYLDTCELNWTRRRVTVVKINKIYIK